MSKKRKDKVELQKKRNLLEPILDKWVYVKQTFDNEERYIYVKHRLRDPKSPNRIEQTIIGPEPYDCGVYYLTDYEIERILDWSRNKEVIEIRPIQYDLEVGLFSEKKKITDFDELKNYLIEKNYLTEEDLEQFGDFRSKPINATEIFLGYSGKKKTI